MISRDKAMTIGIDYGIQEVTTVVVRIPQFEYERLIKEYAVEQVKAVDVSKWGRTVELHEEHDGVGVHSWRYATVTFRKMHDKKEAKVKAVDDD